MHWLIVLASIDGIICAGFCGHLMAKRDPQFRDFFREGK